MSFRKTNDRITKGRKIVDLQMPGTSVMQPAPEKALCPDIRL